MDIPVIHEEDLMYIEDYEIYEQLDNEDDLLEINASDVVLKIYYFYFLLFYEISRK